MAKDTKANSLFGTELNGFKKKQVNEYIAGLEKKHRENLAEQEKLRINVQEELAALKVQVAELQEKYDALQSEKAQVANVLINAERSAANIVDAARQEAACEKERLSKEADVLRDTIAERNGVLCNMKTRSDEILDTLLVDVKNAVSSLEAFIEQGRANMTDSVEAFEEEIAPYLEGDEEADGEATEEALCNEFDIDENECDGESAEDEEELAGELIGGAAEFVFSDMQARDDGVDSTNFDGNFNEMKLDETETKEDFAEV